MKNHRTTLLLFAPDPLQDDAHPVQAQEPVPAPPAPPPSFAPWYHGTITTIAQCAVWAVQWPNGILAISVKR